MSELYLPTEVLLYIFTYLPAKDLVKIRRVCSRWRNIIDSLMRSDSHWREYCKRDYSTIYKQARFKARVGMLWFNIYRSLTLWSQLSHAKEIRDEFASASCVTDEIKGFEVLRDGVIGVHKIGGITYYNIETLEPLKSGTINGDYMHYRENEDTILIRSYHLHLYIIRKLIRNQRCETNVTFDNVKMCIIHDRDIFFVDINNDLYNCKLDDANLTAKYLAHSDESIMCIGYSNQLNILTFQRNIYSIIDGNRTLSCNLDGCLNIANELYKHNLVETVDWRIIYQWMCLFRRKIPEGPLQEILTVKIYGDIVLVGCNWGVFRIYKTPFDNGEFDIYNAVPMRQYNFMQPTDCPVLSMCPILKVEVLESENGHTILIGMPKKIAVIDFVHGYANAS